MKRIIVVSIWLLSTSAHALPERVISLAPHTTELLYALGQGDKLVAVSDHSDYPSEALKLPRVASYHGVDFEAILRLQPDLILAWPGGNKPQDLARLRDLGFTLWSSSPNEPAEIAEDLRRLGKMLDANSQAEQVASKFERDLSTLQNRYRRQNPIPAFYYLWQQPLMSIGQGAWANHLLSLCGAKNVLNALPVDYPTVTLEQVFTAQPQLLIAAIKDTQANQQSYWQQRLPDMDVNLVMVDPDKLHRFTPRLIEGVTELCEQINP